MYNLQNVLLINCSPQNRLSGSLTYQSIGSKLLLKKIEDGVTKADIFLLLALAYALEITVDELLPPTKIDRVEGFLRGVNAKDLIVLHTLLERKPETLKDALSRRIKEVYLEEDAIARGLFFAGVH